MCQEGKVLCGAKVHFDQARFDCHSVSDRALKAPLFVVVPLEAKQGHQGQIRKPRETNSTYEPTRLLSGETKAE